MPVETPSKQVSIYDIAEKLNYTPAGVHKAIERIGIEPEYTTPGGVRYFSRLVIEQLREEMRTAPKKNGNGS